MAGPCLGACPPSPPRLFTVLLDPCEAAAEGVEEGVAEGVGLSHFSSLPLAVSELPDPELTPLKYFPFKLNIFQ